MISKIILDSSFGDSGKGITTDFLCKKNPKSSIVVRFSGGQQAGHNVKIGDISHVHSSFGSGTLRGIPSYFSEHCTMYPVNMYREQEILKDKGIKPNLVLHPLVMVTTPADVAYNRMIESRLGHGTCGLGVGATMKRNINTGHNLYAIDLTHKEIFHEKNNAIYWYYRSIITNSEDISIFNKEFSNEMRYFEKAINDINITIANYDYLKQYTDIIFEGSQGILLDMDHGIFPHVTFANTTSKNALDICNKLNITDIEIYYITRCYQTRHGAGWMSNHDKIKLINDENEINIYNEWQEEFKKGEIDYDLLNYSINVDSIYSNNIKKSLVVTCLDQRPDFIFEYHKLDHKFNKIYESYSPDSKDFEMIQNKY